jgi:hypothetical protein
VLGAIKSDAKNSVISVVTNYRIIFTVCFRKIDIYTVVVTFAQQQNTRAHIHKISQSNFKHKTYEIQSQLE